MRILLLSLLAFCVCGWSGCEFRKYDEGPITSIYPAKDRVVNTWRWKVVIENNVVNTGAYRDSTIQFQSDQVVKICADDNCREGQWDLVRKNTQFQLVFGNSTILFDISMLKRNEIWLRNARTSDDKDLNIEWDLEVVD